MYDNAIAEDLMKSFNYEDGYSESAPMVKVIDPDLAVPIAAQLQDDDIHFPLICVTRDIDYSIDKELDNFTLRHKGIPAYIDTETNEIYNEKSIPIQQNYTINVITTNAADSDELARELIFKYNDMYFLTAVMPYEGHRKFRFGIEINRDDNISRTSGVLEGLSEGKLYSTNIPIKSIGMRLFTYTTVKLRNKQYGVDIISKKHLEYIKSMIPPYI